MAAVAYSIGDWAEKQKVPLVLGRGASPSEHHHVTLEQGNKPSNAHIGDSFRCTLLQHPRRDQERNIVVKKKKKETI